MKVEEVNFIPTEINIENAFVIRKIGKICYICGYCRFSSISTDLENNNTIGTLSVKPITNIRDIVAVSEHPWGSPESIQYIAISANEGYIGIHTNTNYQSKYIYGSYVFVCK